MKTKEIILSDQGGEYTVPVKGGDAVAKEKRYVWVLDFNDSAVYNYEIDYNEHQSTSDIMKILEDVGHDTDHVEWMLSPYDEAINATTDLRKPSKYLENMKNNRRQNTSTDR